MRFAGLLLLVSGHAAASCGSAFCLVNTEWASQGFSHAGGASFDLRYEAIDLDQPMAGRDKVGVGAIPAHHDEVRTENRNVVASLDWSPAPAWSVGVALPFVDRYHEHIHNHHGAKLVERWSFREIGDARAVARYAPWEQERDGGIETAGVTFGIKLPTGKHDVANGEGALAERSLQPGSGTTDAIVGAYWHRAAVSGWSWFARGEFRAPMNERDGYRPGNVAQLDAGVRRAVGAAWAAMLQANAIFKARDRGAEAEPEDSGQRAVYLSPGASWTVANGWSAYAFAQFPVYQSVNGLQLVARWSALAGVTVAF